MLSIAVPMAVLSVAIGWAQSRATAAPAFEVASVKAAAPAERQSASGGPGTGSPGQFNCTGMPLRMLIWRAWNLPPYQLSGPHSIDDAKYDIAVKIPPNTSREAFNLMLQHLLIDRIGLVLRHETQEQTVYELVIAKGGLKMHDPEPAPADATPAGTSPAAGGRPPVARNKEGNLLPPGTPRAFATSINGVMRAMGRMQGIAGLANGLAGSLQHPVINKTGLTGKS